MTGVPSSYHDKHDNSRRGSPWPPRDHERPVPACPDRLMTWRIILLLMTVAVYCINNMNIDTLDTRHYHWNSRTFNHILGLSTAISILYLPLLSTSWIWVAWSVPSWLPCGCFVRKIGSACRTWRQLRGRWWSPPCVWVAMVHGPAWKYFSLNLILQVCLAAASPGHSRPLSCLLGPI